MTRQVDRELLPTDDGWRCPGCRRSFTVFYGIAPRRRCLDCWIAEHPDDPYVKRRQKERP